jgi:hypothetical protein
MVGLDFTVCLCLKAKKESAEGSEEFVNERNRSLPKPLVFRFLFKPTLISTLLLNCAVFSGAIVNNTRGLFAAYSFHRTSANPYIAFTIQFILLEESGYTQSDVLSFHK